MTHVPKMAACLCSGSSNPHPKDPLSRAPVAHTYNLSYLGGRDYEDHGSKPAWAIVHEK
jgi:hypothetical protein